jgi:hypothetical protein
MPQLLPTTETFLLCDMCQGSIKLAATLWPWQLHADDQHVQNVIGTVQAYASKKNR